MVTLPSVRERYSDLLSFAYRGESDEDTIRVRGTSRGDNNDKGNTVDSPTEANDVGAETASAATIPPAATGDGFGPDFVAHPGIGSHLQICPDHHV